MGDSPFALLVIAEGTALRCGPPSGSEHYNSRQMEILETLTQQCALTYRAAYHFRQAEEERTRRLEGKERLLGDLHDGVGAALASIRLSSKEEQVSRLAGDALFELQSFLYRGPEYTLSGPDFVAEVRRYARDVLEDTGVELAFEQKGLESLSLSRSLALSVFRLVKECLANVLKHSGATRVDIALTGGEGLTVKVHDNGRGFQGDSVGRGLKGMQMRIEELGASMRRESNKGALLEFHIPV